MICNHEDGGGGGEDMATLVMVMVMTLMIVCEECMLIEDKVKASCLHFPHKRQGGQ